MKPSSIDRIILGTIILLAALPFAQVFYLEIVGIMLDAFELLYLTLIMIILLKILIFGSIKKEFLPFLLFIVTIILYFIISVNIYGAKSIDIVNQLRHYLPFLIGTMLLVTRTIVKTEKYLRLLTFASIISSTTAMIIHHLMPELLADLLFSSEELVSITTIHGRLYWANACLVFFVTLSFMLTQRKIHVNKAIMSIALFLTFVGLVNTVNRTMIIGLVFLLVGYSFLEKHIILSIKRSKKAIGLGVIGALIIFGLMSVYPKVKYLIEKRYLRSGYEQVYETALVKERFPIYAQYANSIKTYFPVGQGLGKPFHIRFNGIRVPITDISIISFLLPFGPLGLIVFCIFIYTLFRLVSRANNSISERAIRIFKLFLITSLIMSLNIDLFSRNNFVIFVTMLVLTLQNGSSHPRTRVQPRIT